MKTVDKIVNKMWRGMNQRCSQGYYLRKGIKVDLSELQFKVWARKEVANFLWLSSDSIPSVDRINPDKNYEKGNLRIIDLWKNRAQSRHFCNCIGVSKKMKAKDSISRIAYLLQSILGQLDISMDLFCDFLKSGIDRNNDS